MFYLFHVLCVFPVYSSDSDISRHLTRTRSSAT
uniref:Uncharacterized protein n=1 Tax=Nelumbo nucifera TaxID=4432 RepID=A0A822Z2B1_NELNU|nr:TPA_asm: hypothetical protein HUJ06_008462 [Nelumbo nucifera]